MKITRIQADNILGLSSIDVKLHTSITLFAGRNGSGKSSIQEAVRMAICQDQVRDITKKNQFDALVHEGSKAGGAQVIIDDDQDMTFAFNMPKGDFTGPEITESMRVALHGQRFALMTPDQRRTFLFGLTKLKPNAETVKARMLTPKWACEESKIDAVLPLLRTGFPSVCEHAKSKATESKGAWRALTGEIYGVVKAPAWEAELPEVPEGDLVLLTSKISGLEKNIASMSESLGSIKNAARVAADTANKRTALAGSGERVISLKDQLERAKAELAEYEPKVIALRERAAGKARIGLVHEMAIYINKVYEESQDDEDEAFDLVRRYNEEYGSMDAKIDNEAQSMLPDHEKGLQVMQNRVTNLQRDLDSAIQAKGQFDALAPDGNVTDSSKEIADLEGMIATAKADREQAQATTQTIITAQKARTAAGDKTKQALAHHEDVVAWSKVADALAPDGIPAEMLVEALAPVNLALAQAAVDTEWMKTVIHPDMSITADQRPYHLLSESERWRCDAMIAQVVAEISGLKILMLDRVDVLDLPGRAQLFTWMDTLADLELIDTALLFGTLKSLPDLGDAVECFWVEDGKIKQPAKLAAA